MYAEDQPVRLGNLDAREQEVDARARNIREKYEERLAGMTDRIRAILEEIKNDEVIATMQDDPASAPFIRARMRELAEDHFGQEREETIEKLVKEVAFLHSENQRLDRECAQAKNSTRSLEEQFRQERSRVEITEREVRDLRSKSAISGRQYEDSVRKLAEDSAASLKLAQGEAEKLREKLEQSERSIWVKSSEVEMLKQDLEAEKTRSAKMLVELSSIKRAYQDLEEDYGKMQNSLQSSSGSSSDLVQKLTRAREEISSLESTIKSYEREREELKSKYLAYSREFKEVLETEQKSTAEAIESLQQKHKEKCHLLKKKVLEQRTRLRDKDVELTTLHSELDSTRESYEHSIELMQTDLRHVRDEWEKKCAETEDSCGKKLSELANKHKSQLAAVQSQCQSLLDEKIKEMTEEFAHQQAKQRQNEADLRRLLDEKMQAVDKEYIRTNKHEAIISDEITRLKAQFSAEKRNFEENFAAEWVKKTQIIKDEHESDLQRLYQKLKSAEDREESCESAKRKSDRELEYANERIELLNSKLASLNGEITELEANKKAVVRHLDEAAVNIGKLKAMYEDEANRRKALDEQLAALRDKLRTSESTISLKDSDFQQELHALKLSHIESSTKLQESLEREQATSRKYQSELLKLKESHEALHVEKKELHESHTKTAEELKQNSIRMKQEGVSLYEEEAEAHRETQRILEQRNATIKGMTEAIEDLKGNVSESNAKIGSLRREIDALESHLKSQKDQNLRLSTDKTTLIANFDRQKLQFASFKSRARKSVKSLAQQYQSRLAEIQRSLLADLSEFKKFLSKQIAESISGVEDLQLKQRRAFNLTLIAKEDLIRAAEKEKLRFQQELSESFDTKTAVYETHIDSLKSSLSQLKSDIAGKNSELATFVQKINDFQQEQTRLHDENLSLQTELQHTVQELEYSKLESQEVESRLKTSFQDEISGREVEIEDRYKGQLTKLEELVTDLKGRNEATMSRFTDEVRQLQDQHRDELGGLKQSYEKTRDDLARMLQVSERERQERDIDLEEMIVEIAAMKVDFSRFADAVDEEVGDLVAILHSEQEKQTQFRQEKTAEIEEFARKLKVITRELQEKDENLEKTNRDKETLRNQLKEIRDSQVQKEISEIKGSLERSMSKESRKNRRPEEESVAERPVEGRKIPLSLSQLKASLEKYS